MFSRLSSWPRCGGFHRFGEVQGERVIVQQEVRYTYGSSYREEVLPCETTTGTDGNPPPEQSGNCNLWNPSCSLLSTNNKVGMQGNALFRHTSDPGMLECSQASDPARSKGCHQGRTNHSRGEAPEVLAVER